MSKQVLVALHYLRHVFALSILVLKPISCVLPNNLSGMTEFSTLREIANSLAYLLSVLLSINFFSRASYLLYHISKVTVPYSKIS